MSMGTMDEPFLLLDLLKILTTPPKNGAQHDSWNSQDALGSMLESQLKRAHAVITEDPKYSNLDLHIDKFCSGNGDVHWRFVGFLLRLLLLYKIKVTEVVPRFEEEVKRLDKLKRTEDTAPPMSPDTLGSSHVTTVVSALQFIACLGICPALLPGVGVPVNMRSQMIGKISQPHVDLSREVRDRRLTHCVAVLLECLQLQTTLRSMILSHCCGDILAMLVQLSYAPLPRPKGAQDQNSSTAVNSSSPGPVEGTNLQEKSEESLSQEDLYLLWKEYDNLPLNLSDRKWARKQLLTFTRGIPVQPLIKEVLILQGGPPSGMGAAKKKSPLTPAPMWLRKYCGFLLSECLIRPHGVINVLRGLLADTTDFEVGNKSSSVEWQKCEAVAKVIASCPQQMEFPNLYYASVGRQVVELLHLKNDVVAKQLVRVAAAAIAAMMELHPQVAMEKVMKPMMEPLLGITAESDIKKPQQSDILVEEEQMTTCIEDVHKVFVSGSAPHSSLLSSLLLILQPIFKLYVFASSGVYAIRLTCEDILAVYLKQASMEDALGSLRLFIFSKTDEDCGLPNAGVLHHGVYFSAGPTGGVVAVWKDERAEDLENDIESVAKGISQLLRKLNRPEVTAELFLFLLKRLSSIIKEEVDPEQNSEPFIKENKSTIGREVLEVTTGMDDVKDNLIVLTVLAHMTDQLGPECFTKTQHIVDFVQVTLERGVTVLKNTDDEMVGVFENETVTMAMGMLTAVMGGAKKLSTEEKMHLKSLLPLLQELSEQHPDPSIQEMSSDLGIAIATHGFILSDSLQKSSNQKAASKSHDDLLTNQKTESVPSPAPKKVQKKPLIEVISSSENVGSDEKISPTSEISVKQESRDADSQTHKNISERKFTIEMKQVNDQTAKVCDSRKSSENQEISKYKEAINCLLDPLLPVRGHGLILMARLLKERDPETMQNYDMLLKVFQENIRHEDSYLYLAAINGLSALAVHSPDQVLPVLAKFYCQRVKEEKSVTNTTKQKERNIEWRLKLGETLVKTCKALGDFVPSYRDMLVSSCLTVAKDEEPLVRASAISNLGDICRLLRFSLGNIIFQVLDCVTALLRSDPDVEVRKSAAMFTTLLLQGLGRDAMKVLEHALHDLYRLLKMTLTVEKEEMVKVHVQLSLDELDSITREFLFPKQTLTKHIYVADAPPN